MSIYSNLAQNKTGPEVGPFLVAARTFVPELTAAPDRSLAALGPEYKDYCMAEYGRIADCKTVYQTGFAAGQIDPNYVMLGPDMVTRPNVEMKVGLTQPPILGVLENPGRVTAYGSMPENSVDPIVSGAIKGNSMGRFEANSASYASIPKISNYPFASAFAMAAAGDTAKLQATAPSNSFTMLAGMGGGQRTCGQVPLVSSVAPEDEFWTYGTDYKYTPMSPVIVLPGNSMQTVEQAYNLLKSTGQLGSDGSVSKSGQFA
jgi:hypothetical protein